MYTDGFTYQPANEAPTVTNPKDQEIEVGGAAQFSVTAAGVPTPEVWWETSSDAGATWFSIDTDSAAEVGDGGQTLTVTGNAENDQYQYRAIATNSEGTATSAAATLTVTPDDTDGGDADGDDGDTDAGSDGNTDADGGDADTDGSTDEADSDGGSTDGSDLPETGFGLGIAPFLALGAAAAGIILLGIRKLHRA